MVGTKERLEKENYIGQNGMPEKNFKYSVMNLKSYDNVRCILIQDAYSLIEEQKDSNLPVNKLEEAVKNKELIVYEFKGKKYIDRLDIGRIYHQSPEKKEGLTIERYFSEEGKNPFESVGKYESTKLSIKDWNTGKVVFEMNDAYFPESWGNQV